MSNTVTVNVQLKLTRKAQPFTSEEAMLHWVANCLNCNTNHVEAAVSLAEAPTVIVEMDGGLIENMEASGPVKVVVLDFDVDGADVPEQNIIFGKKAFINNHGLIEIDDEHVKSVVLDVEKIEAISDQST